MFTGMGIVSGISSGARGLIPKSTGGRMALGAGGALGLAGGVSMARRRRANNAAVDAGVQDMFRQDVIRKIQSGQLAAPPGAASMRDNRTGQIYQL